MNSNGLLFYRETVGRSTVQLHVKFMPRKNFFLILASFFHRSLLVFLYFLFIVIDRYVEREFPENKDGKCTVYSVPRYFQKAGENQAISAEHRVFSRFHGLKEDLRLKNTWVIFFHSASYAGHSYRNNRCGKLMIREHDFVIFVKKNGK